eukprot:m.19765 g.19765  ORF g.19765 m.19765 type:complete len:290 (-) comp7661_c0_seq2:26-895(-)
MAVDLQHCLKFATSVAKRVGVLVYSAYCTPREDSIVKDKSNSIDLVTNTDQESERQIFAALKAEFPDFEFLGEEAASEAGAYSLTDKPTWIVDPIDGTTNFVHRNPEIAISIGLSVAKEPVVGVIYNPVRDELFTACRGGGAFLNGAPIRVDTVAKDLGEGLATTNLGYGREPHHIKHTLGTLEAIMQRGVRGVRMGGSACTAIAGVACGRVNVYYESGPHAWDVCAGAVLVREAGGVVLDMSGRPLDLCSRAYIFASTPEIASQTGRCVVYPIPYYSLTPAPTHHEFS